MTDYLFRYEDSKLTRNSNIRSEDVRPVLKTYTVLEDTANGYTIEYLKAKKKVKLVSLKSTFAHKTKLKALQDYIERKARQEGLLKSNLTITKTRKDEATKMLAEVGSDPITTLG